MNNNCTSKLGEWTELNLQELDLICGGPSWNIFNGYVFDLLGPDYLFSKPLADIPDPSTLPFGPGESFDDHGEERLRWVDGKHIFDMKLGWSWGAQYVYFKDNKDIVWRRKVNLGWKGNGHGFEKKVGRRWIG